MTEKKRILWISWHSTPYNDYLFNQVNNDYDLTVIFIKSKLISHPWENHSSLTFKYVCLDQNICKCFQLLIKKYDLRIVAGWNNLFLVIGLLIFSILNNKFVIWTDTPKKAGKRGLFKKMYHYFFIKTVIKKAYSILVTGNIGVKVFKEIYGNNLKVINFPFATNLDFFNSLVLREKGEDKVFKFLSVGRLVNWHKGYDVAIKAFNIVKNKCPDVTIKYVILGEGPDRPYLEKLINKYDLDNWVKLPGWCSPHEILREMRSSRVFIHPSHFDPFPNVVLEAMAVGLPIIGSNAAGSVLDRVEINVNGYIFDDNDHEMLADKIVYVLNNLQILGSLSISARHTAEVNSVNYNIEVLNKLTK